MTMLRIGICVDKDNVSRTSHVLRRTLQTQLDREALEQKEHSLFFFDNGNLLKD